jgi:hypothetical protein
VRRDRPVLATILGVVLVSIAAAVAGLVISSGVLWDDAADDPGIVQSAGVDLGALSDVGGVALDGLQPAAIASGFQGQPRDPFKPLIPSGTTSSTSTTDGSGTTSSTTPGGTTSTTDFDPDSYRVSLVAIDEVAGTLRATVLVNGQTYNVGVGETFASVFKLVRITATNATFMFGDRAFVLAVGQEILK